MSTKVQVKFEESTVQQLVVSLVNRLQRLENGRRYILGITGYPGSGKTTIGEWLVKGVNELLENKPASLISMDGFHYSNEKLTQMQLLGLKGTPDSFDAASFVSLLSNLRKVTDHTVYCPRFDRTIEASIENAIAIQPLQKLCVVEGNYLLLSKSPWNECKNYLDEVWFLDVTFDTILPRLYERHLAGGRSDVESRAEVELTDLLNAKLVEQTKVSAEKLIRVTEGFHNDNERVPCGCD